MPGDMVKIQILVQKVCNGAGEAALVRNAQVMLKLLPQDHSWTSRASLLFHVLSLAELIFLKRRTGSWVYSS